MERDSNTWELLLLGAAVACDIYVQSSISCQRQRQRQCQFDNNTASCLSGRWKMLEKQIFILVFARVYICVLFFTALQNMRVCVGCCWRARNCAGGLIVRLPSVTDICHAQRYSEILVIKRAHKYINSFERAALPPLPPTPQILCAAVYLSRSVMKMAARSCRFYTSYCVRVHENGNLIF